MPFDIFLKSSLKALPFKISMALSLIFNSKIDSSAFLSFKTDSISDFSIDNALSSFSIPCLLNTLTSTTVPPVPEGIFKEVSLTSMAFSPNIALNNFSSDVTLVSPFGVSFPTKISPGFTSAPT